MKEPITIPGYMCAIVNILKSYRTTGNWLDDQDYILILGYLKRIEKLHKEALENAKIQDDKSTED